MLYSTYMAIVGVKELTHTVLDKIIRQQHVSTLEMRDEIFTFESFINFVNLKKNFETLLKFSLIFCISII